VGQQLLQWALRVDKGVCVCVCVQQGGGGLTRVMPGRAAVSTTGSSAAALGSQMPSCQVCLLHLPVMDADAMAGTNWSTVSATSAPPGLSKAAPGCGSSSALLASVALSLSLGLCWWLPAVHTGKHTLLLGRVAAIHTWPLLQRISCLAQMTASASAHGSAAAGIKGLTCTAPQVPAMVKAAAIRA
jgi:hypothetical protein